MTICLKRQGWGGWCGGRWRVESDRVRKEVLSPGVGGAWVDGALGIKKVGKRRGGGESNFEPAGLICASDRRFKRFPGVDDGLLEVSSQSCFGDSGFA